jgi:hypothetical protein
MGHAPVGLALANTDFSLTRHFDAWDARAGFIFGVDAMPSLVELAQAVAEHQWTPFWPLLRRGEGEAANE